MKVHLPRAFCLLILFIYNIQSAYSCFCVTVDFCSYVDSYKDDPTLLAFKGSYIQSTPSGSDLAFQFKVEEIYFGEIVTPDSPFYDGEDFANTDSTVWVLAGVEEACMRWIQETDAIFVVPYKTGVPLSSETFGYVPSICNTDYFPISDSDEITGPIWHFSEDVTMDLMEFEQIILNECSSITYIEDRIYEEDCIDIYPQPVEHILNIDICNTTAKWNIKLYSTSGQQIMNIQDSRVDISNLENGIYYLSFTEAGGKNKYYRKVIKI